MTRQDMRNTYPFHNATVPAPRGYRPAPVKQPHRFASVLLQLVGACLAISTCAYTVLGFLLRW